MARIIGTQLHTSPSADRRSRQIVCGIVVGLDIFPKSRIDYELIKLIKNHQALNERALNEQASIE